ncbi:MAG: energy-coupling factor transporter transmembrane protein EcfT [Thermoflavifilum sp.]|nr:energy-coupling factor transporter transmembrane protein EcfT [Thermoflavifilum sp.]MCL6513845.1 energy-coupling factor transporter transmembrane protein EcfT [Alicyclobacillus sp.]
MADFELARYVTIGQYLATDSVIHRLDPRVKLVAFVLWVVAASCTGSLLGNAVLLILGLAGLALARIPLRFGLSGVVPAIPLILLMSVLMVLFYQPDPGAHVWLHWRILTITWEGVRLALVSAARFIEMVMFISILTLSTTLSDLTRALEALLRPLRALRFPADEAALMVSIALRFVPTLAQEAERLMKAQAARGADIGTARPWQLIRRTRSVLPVIVPLFVSALRRADELVLAMEARGYVPGAPRSSYVEYAARGSDAMALALTVLLCALIVWLPWPW